LWNVELAFNDRFVLRVFLILLLVAANAFFAAAENLP